jgi:transposase
MDTLNSGLAWRKRGDQTVARKTYSEEFRRDAVELYRSTPGATTVVGIAGDLRIMDTTLSAWLKAAGAPVRSRPPSFRRRVPAGG